MKKIATILTIVAALLVGGMTIDAKTTKKTTKTSQSQKSSSSLTPKSFISRTSGGYELKSYEQIKSILTSNGYKYRGGEYTQFSELDADGYIFTDSKGNEVVVTVVNDSNAGVTSDVVEISFRFTNSGDRDKFLKGEKSNVYGAHDQVQVEVSGNTVTMSDDCYYC